MYIDIWGCQTDSPVSQRSCMPIDWLREKLRSRNSCIPMNRFWTAGFQLKKWMRPQYVSCFLWLTNQHAQNITNQNNNNLSNKKQLYRHVSCFCGFKHHLERYLQHCLAVHPRNVTLIQGALWYRVRMPRVNLGARTWGGGYLTEGLYHAPQQMPGTLIPKGSSDPERELQPKKNPSMPGNSGSRASTWPLVVTKCPIVHTAVWSAEEVSAPMLTASRRTSVSKRTTLH